MRGPPGTGAELGEFASALCGTIRWFNTRRLHSSLANAPSVEHEQRHVAALAANTEALPFPTGPVTPNADAVYDPFGVVSDPRNQTITLTR